MRINAAFDESLLGDFLESLANALGGQNTALMRLDMQSARNNAVLSVRTDPEHLRRYNEDYCDINPWMRKGASKLTFVTVGVGEMHVTGPELVRTEHYNDWL